MTVRRAGWITPSGVSGNRRHGGTILVGGLVPRALLSGYELRTGYELRIRGPPVYVGQRIASAAAPPRLPCASCPERSLTPSHQAAAPTAFRCGTGWPSSSSSWLRSS